MSGCVQMVIPDYYMLEFTSNFKLDKFVKSNNAHISVDHIKVVETP